MQTKVGRQRMRRAARGLGTALALAFGLAGAAHAYTFANVDLGPGFISTLVTRNASDQRVVQVLIKPDDGVTYRVYRHAHGDVRDFVYLKSVTFNASNPPGNPGTNYWNYDSAYGYVYYEDGNVTDYQEYYYFVKDGDDPVGISTLTGQVYDPLWRYFVARAFPPTQTRHGEFSEYTNACTGCHGLHSSRSRQPGLGKLLRAPTQTDLCATCHDGSASKYDEVLGRVRTGATWADYSKAPAGPFGTQFKAAATAPCAPNESPCASGIYLTAVHNVWRYGLTADGMGVNQAAAQMWQAPGSTFLRKSNAASWDTTQGTTWTKPLMCTGCHEPHNRFKNFRLLRGDFDYGNYDLADSPAIARRKDVNVRGVSEVYLSCSAGQDCMPPNDGGNNYTKGAMATRYLGGGMPAIDGLTGGGITDLCTGCHRYFADSLTANGAIAPNGNRTNELDPNNTNTDTFSNDNSGTHGWKRHRMAATADTVLTAGRVIDPGATTTDLNFKNGFQASLVDWDSTNLRDYEKVAGSVYTVYNAYVPLEGFYQDNPATTTVNEYAYNKIVCLTCHVPHGTSNAAGGYVIPGDTKVPSELNNKLQLEVAYWNYRVNATVYTVGSCSNGLSMPRNSATDVYCATNDTVYQFQYNRNIGLVLGRAYWIDTATGYTYTGYLTRRRTGPNGESGVIYGYSAALARFQPFASICWRCHSTR